MSEVTLQYINEECRLEECYTIKADMEKSKLLDIVNDCIAIAYKSSDLVSAEEDNDIEFIKDEGCLDVFNILKSK